MLLVGLDSSAKGKDQQRAEDVLHDGVGCSWETTEGHDKDIVLSSYGGVTRGHRYLQLRPGREKIRLCPTALK